MRLKQTTDACGVTAGNCLKNVPDSVTQLTHLQDLNVSGNQLTFLPDGISALTALTMLSLHGNQLQQLPQFGWDQLQSLKEVTLQGNLLTNIPESFAKLGVSGCVHKGTQLHWCRALYCYQHRQVLQC